MKNFNKKLLSIPLLCAFVLPTVAFTNADVVETESTEETEQTEVVEESEENISDEELEEVIEFELDEIEETVSEVSEELAGVEEISEEPEVETIETAEDEDMAGEAITEIEVVYMEETEATEPEVVEEYINLYNYENCSYVSGEVNPIMYSSCDMNVRSLADPNAEVLTTISKGSTVTMIATAWDSPWALVEVNGVRGYAISLNLFVEYVDGIEFTEAEAEEIYAS